MLYKCGPLFVFAANEAGTPQGKVVTYINNFQRIGADHNAGVGRLFEGAAQKFFLEKEGIELVPNFPVEVGISSRKKKHRFDLGSADPAVIVECKSHKWTQTGNMPAAKMTVWNEAMYYFHVAPKAYRKIMFVLKHDRRGQSLAAYYIHTHGHLVPDGVEIWEFNEETRTGAKLL